MSPFFFWTPLLLSCKVTAHSWIDSLSTNTSNLGYIRGYAGHIDSISTHLITRRSPDAPLCHSKQNTAVYSSKYPMLQVNSGDSVSASYLENGHTTKDMLPPDNKPHPGTYTWYWTNAISLDTVGDVHKPGVQVLATGNFDDGLCAEDATRGRAGPRPCLSTFTIPCDTPDGIYMIVWLWNFPKVAGAVEMYSSCADIKVINAPKAESLSEPSISRAGKPALTSPQTVLGHASLTVGTTSFITSASKTSPSGHLTLRTNHGLLTTDASIALPPKVSIAKVTIC